MDAWCSACGDSGSGDPANPCTACRRVYADLSAGGRADVQGELDFWGDR